MLANPRNWRVHPRYQQEALKATLAGVGWVQNVIVNKRTGHVVDGHARVALALREELNEIPVVYVDLDESEEAIVLATFDPIGAMATTDRALLDDVLQQAATTDDDIKAVLADVEERLVGIVKELPPAPTDAYYDTARLPVMKEPGAAGNPAPPEGGWKQFAIAMSAGEFETLHAQLNALGKSWGLTRMVDVVLRLASEASEDLARREGNND